jgi:hypothetical protein
MKTYDMSLLLHPMGFQSNTALKLPVPMLRYVKNICGCNDDKHICKPLEFFNSFIRMDQDL